MARDKSTLQNIDLSNTSDYLNGRIKDNTGGGNGTPVNERVYGDMHQTFAKLMNLAGLNYNGLPDNETNGYQIVEALRSLPSKNNVSYTLNQSGSNLTLPLRLGKLRENEFFTVKASFDKSTETSLKGTLDNVTKTISYLGDFKTGDYLKVINTPSQIILIPEVDNFNLNRMVESFNFLKKASETQEFAGTSNTVATTPATNLAAFERRVTGGNSFNYLAAFANDGLMSKEHYAIIENLGQPALRNRGSFVLGDIGPSPVGTNFVSSGDITAKKVQDIGNADIVEITFDNAMDNTDYKIQIDVQSLGDFNFDNDYIPIPFKVDTTTKGRLFIQELGQVAQNLKIHVDIIQL